MQIKYLLTKGVSLVAIIIGIAIMSSHFSKIQASSNCTWNGSVSNLWSNGANWTNCGGLGGIPTSTDTLNFDSTGAHKADSNNDIIGLTADFINISGANYTLSGNTINLSSNVIFLTNSSSTIGIAISLSSSGGIITTNNSQLSQTGTITTTGLVQYVGDVTSDLFLNATLTASEVISNGGSMNVNASIIENTTFHVTNNGIVNIGIDNFLPTSTGLDISGGAKFNTFNHLVRINKLDGIGTINFGSGGLIIANSPTPGIGGNYTGILTGTGDLIINSSSQAISGNNTYTGTTTISDNSTGDYFAIGAGTLSSSAVNYNAVGTFGLGANTNTKILNLAGGNVNINIGPNINIGNLNLSNGVTYLETINSISSFASVTASTGISILNANLSVCGSNTYGHVGHVYTIIQGNGENPIFGTFNGLPEGATTNCNNGKYRISYVGGTGHDITLTEIKVDPLVVLTTNPNPSTLGQSVTLNANVTGGLAQPTGNVTFIVDGNPLNPVNLSGANASISLTNLTKGAHTVFVVYNADNQYNSANGIGSLDQIVTSGTTSLTIVSSLNPAAVTQNVTFTATVNASSAIPTTGNVVFSEGGNTLGTVNLINNVAVFTTSSLSIGNHTIVATYAGDPNYSGSTGNITEMVVATLAKTGIEVNFVIPVLAILMSIGAIVGYKKIKLD